MLAPKSAQPPFRVKKSEVFGIRERDHVKIPTLFRPVVTTDDKLNRKATVTIGDNPCGIAYSWSHPARPTGDGLDFRLAGDITAGGHYFWMFEDASMVRHGGIDTSFSRVLAEVCNLCRRPEAG